MKLKKLRPGLKVIIKKAATGKAAKYAGEIVRLPKDGISVDNNGCVTVELDHNFNIKIHHTELMKRKLDFSTAELGLSLRVKIRKNSSFSQIYQGKRCMIIGFETYGRPIQVVFKNGYTTRGYPQDFRRVKKFLFRNP